MIEFFFDLVVTIIGLGIAFVVLTLVGAILFAVFSSLGLAFLGVPAVLAVLIVAVVLLPISLPILVPLIAIGLVLSFFGLLLCGC